MMSRPTAAKPAIDRSSVVGQGRNAENGRIRRANLACDVKCLAELKTKRAGSEDLFGRTVEQLEESIRFQQATLRIAESGA
jgi:hypothetical protein